VYLVSEETLQITAFLGFEDYSRAFQNLPTLLRVFWGLSKDTVQRRIGHNLDSYIFMLKKLLLAASVSNVRPRTARANVWLLSTNDSGKVSCV
jgi:hypothetical protein